MLVEHVIDNLLRTLKACETASVFLLETPNRKKFIILVLGLLNMLE
jgi:hypothetical protein